MGGGEAMAWCEKDFKDILLGRPEYEQRTRKILAALDGLNILRAQELLKAVSDSLLFIKVNQNSDGNDWAIF